MAFSSWFRFLKNYSSNRITRGRAHRPRSAKLLLEALEARTLLSATVFDAEPNETLATALALSGGQAQGYIGNNTHQPGKEAQDVDLYKVDLAQGDLASFGGADVHGWQNVRLRLFDAAGADLSGRVSYWNTFYARQAGAYYVGLSAAGNAAYDPVGGAAGQGGAWTGGYTLTCSVSHLTFDETEDNDGVATADA